MKKKFVLILEFESEIGEKLDIADKEKAGYLKGLLQELLKKDRAILEIYKLWLFADFANGNQFFEMDMSHLKKTNEIELIRPVLTCLPKADRKYFAEVLKMDEDSINFYFEGIFEQFGTLQVTKANFMERGK